MDIHTHETVHPTQAGTSALHHTLEHGRVRDVRRLGFEPHDWRSCVVVEGLMRNIVFGSKLSIPPLLHALSSCSRQTVCKLIDVIRGSVIATVIALDLKPAHYNLFIGKRLGLVSQGLPEGETIFD